VSFLYRSASGKEVQHGSNSSLSTYRTCRRKFKLNRVDGWRQKGHKAALEFGKAVEDAIMYYHANGLKKGDCLEEFQRIWLKWANQDLQYTDQEGDFFQLMNMGKEAARLYEARLPSLPIRNPKFQLQYLKKVFEGTELNDLEFMGYVDMLSTLEDGSRLIIDIKTAKSGLDLTPNMLSMDPQLREYAWLSGIRDVAFLWFVKSKASVKKGDTVSLLEEGGIEMTAFKYQKDDETGEEKVLLGHPTAVQILDDQLSEIKGKGSTKLQEAFVDNWVELGIIRWVPRDQLAKVRLQFVRGSIPAEALPEVGERIGHLMVQIKDSTEKNFWPLDGGVRFPNAICGWCEQRGHCLKQPDLVDKFLVQIKTKEEDSEQDWLDDLTEG
jgi:hypothetical protein